MLSSDVDLLYSVKLRRNLHDGSDRVPFGAAHYSYGSVAEKFREAFHSYGLSPREVDRPEIYPPLSHADRKTIHIAFKPYEELRILYGAVNIAHVAWEFDIIPTRADWRVGDPRRDGLFNDYVHMLKLPQHIWVGSEYTRSIFLKYGLRNVSVVPAPIATPIPLENNFSEVRDLARRIGRQMISGLSVVKLDRRLLQRVVPLLIEQNRRTIGQVLAEADKVFLTVANPGDLRKNLPAIIDGFSIISQRMPRLALIIKVTVESSAKSVATMINETLRKRYSELEMVFGDISPVAVYLLPNRLSIDEMVSLQACADFYITSAFAEGQNLPLLEAMSVGTVPIAPVHTAMMDYIFPHNAIVMPSTRAKAPACFETAYGLQGLEISWSSVESVADCVALAAEMSAAEREARGRAAWETINDKYSFATLADNIGQLLRAC